MQLVPLQLSGQAPIHTNLQNAGQSRCRRCQKGKHYYYYPLYKILYLEQHVRQFARILQHLWHRVVALWFFKTNTTQINSFYHSGHQMFSYRHGLLHMCLDYPHLSNILQWFHIDSLNIYNRPPSQTQSQTHRMSHTNINTHSSLIWSQFNLFGNCSIEIEARESVNISPTHTSDVDE